jgi:hypothetical protein
MFRQQIGLINISSQLKTQRQKELQNELDLKKFKNDRIFLTGFSGMTPTQG